jgi:hypothetical protein
MDHYLDMLNELDALLDRIDVAPFSPDSPEGLRARVLLDTLSALDKQI